MKNLNTIKFTSETGVNLRWIVDMNAKYKQASRRNEKIFS